MHDGRLVAPIHKVTHRGFIRRGRHVFPHACLAVPGRHRPKRPGAVSQERAVLKTGGVPDLLAGAEEIHCEGRQEPDRPDSEARNADEGYMLSS